MIGFYKRMLILSRNGIQNLIMKRSGRRWKEENKTGRLKLAVLRFIRVIFVYILSEGSFYVV